MSVAEKLYDTAYYGPHGRRSGYKVLADFLRTACAPRSAADFGCGIGATLHHLREQGCEVLGIDGSEAAQEAARVEVVRHDLTAPIDLGRRFDLVLSTEVAEHLPEAAADPFVATLARHAARWVFFTAAPPGQDGIGHINCRPKAYWVEKFHRHGLRRSRLLEACARAALYPLIWDAWWIRRNALVFARPPLPRLRPLKLLPGFVGAALRWRWQAYQAKLGSWR
jgi:SAM-dependent methyltransferase